MQLILPKISHPAMPLPVAGSIKNIIFDFGGVICDLDLGRTEKQLAALGYGVDDPARPVSDTAKIVDQLESGAISAQEFRDRLKHYFRNPVTDAQIDEAWNALLAGMPEPRIRLLERVRKNYRIFLLTNTNAIHYAQYVETFRRQYGYDDFDGLFEKAYYSYRIGRIKPDPEIFRHVLRESRLLPGETLFIDDTRGHVESARSLGIHGHLLQIRDGEQIMDLFEKD